MKNILVVGGTSGIGSALVSALLQSGGNSVINMDKNVGDGIKSPNINHIQCDLSDDQSIIDGITTLKSVLNGIKIDTIYYCAGIAEDPTAELKTDFNFINKLVAINSTSLVKVLSHTVPMMNNISGTPSIVVVSSAHSIRAANWNPIYSGTKGFIDSFVKSYSKSLIVHAKTTRTQLIRINAVNPEMVDTPLIHNLFVGREDDLKKVVDSRIMGRLIESNEVVDAMLFLASPESSAITGNIMPIGGNI